MWYKIVREQQLQLMFNFRTLSLALFAIFVLASCSNKALQLSLTPDDRSFTYQLTQNVDNTIGVMGMDQQTALEQVISYAYNIEKVNPDGSMELTMSIAALRMEQATPMMNMVFDSEKPEDNEPADAVSGMKNVIGKKFDIKLSKSGEVLEVKGEENMFKGAFDGVPNGEMMEQQMEAQFGESTIVGSLRQLTGFYPTEAVKVGDSWTKESDAQSAMPMKAETTYTLKERKNGIATIEFTRKLKTDPDGKPMEMMGMEMSYDMSGTESGTYLVDEKTGWATSMEATQDMGGKMSMKGGPMGEMQADMKVATKNVYKRKN